jgi:hypothetical protein
MKKNNQGFIVPTMIAIVLILILGGGTYVYLESKKVNKAEIDNMKTEVMTTSTSVTGNTPSTPQDNQPTSTSPKNVDQSTSSVSNITDTVVVTKKKDGNKTVTKSATSRTSTFIGNDGSISSITTSKEEEEYIKKNTIYSCGNENCFNENFKNCTTVTMTSDLEILGKIFYEIKPKTQNVCTLTFKYLRHPNPEYTGKEMTCEVNNKLSFENSSTEMYLNSTLKGNPSNCSGSFYEDIKYK